MKSFFIVLLTLIGLGTYAVAADANATKGKKPQRTIRHPARPLWLGRAASDPSASRWMLRLDMEAFRKTQLGLFLLIEAKEFASPIDAAANMLQFDPRKDLTAITAIGSMNQEEDQKHGVLLVHGKFQPDHLLKLAKTNTKNFKEEDLGETLGMHKLLSWKETDKESGEEKTQYGCIASEKLIVMGSGAELVKFALKHYDVENPNQKAAKIANTILNRGLKFEGKPYFLAGAVRIRELKVPPEAKILEKVTSLGFTFAEEKGNLKGLIKLNAEDEDSSIQIQQMIQGLLALSQLSSIGETDDNSKRNAAILKSIKIDRNATMVSMTMDAAMTNITASLRYQLAKAKEEKAVEAKETPKKK